MLQQPRFWLLGVISAARVKAASVTGGSPRRNPELVERLDPQTGSRRLINLMTAWKHEIKELMGGMGINSIEALRGNRLMLRGIGLNEKELEILGISHAGE